MQPTNVEAAIRCLPVRIRAVRQPVRISIAPEAARDADEHIPEMWEINLRGREIALSVAAFSALLSMVIGMITPRQIRAARALLGWSQQQLADKAIVSFNALARLERGEVDPRMSTLMAVNKALTEAGIEFLAADVKGEGVRLASPSA
jgi:DNA-binding XRE family transcriptional regulator